MVAVARLGIALAFVLLLLPLWSAFLFAVLPEGMQRSFQAGYVLGLIGLIWLYRRFIEADKGSGAGPNLNEVQGGFGSGKFWQRVWRSPYRDPLLFAFLVLPVTYVFLMRYRYEPLGHWDAWAIWNPRIRDFSLGFLWGTGVDFVRLDWAHPDYAPLAAISVAGPVVFWERGVDVLPHVWNWLYFVATLALLLRTAGPLLAHEWLRPLILCAGIGLSPLLLHNATDQYADNFLALGLLFSMMLVQEQGRDGFCSALLSGLCLGSLPLIKNEGFFMLVPLLGMYFWRWRPSGSGTLLLRIRQTVKDRGGSLFGFGLAIAILLGLLAWYKLSVGRAQPYAVDVNAMVARFLDPGRQLAVLERWLDAHLVLSLGFLPVALALTWRPRGLRAFGFLGLLFVLAVYHVVFVVTPADQKWHLDTAFSRITVVVYPAWAYLCLLVLSDQRSAEEVKS